MKKLVNLIVLTGSLGCFSCLFSKPYDLNLRSMSATCLRQLDRAITSSQQQPGVSPMLYSSLQDNIHQELASDWKEFDSALYGYEDRERRSEDRERRRREENFYAKDAIELEQLERLAKLFQGKGKDKDKDEKKPLDIKDFLNSLSTQELKDLLLGLKIRPTTDMQYTAVPIYYHR